MGDPLGPVRGRRSFARHRDRTRRVARGEASTGIDRRHADRLLALYLEEREAAVAASISHGAISAKFAAAAAAKRAARGQLWRRTHDPDAVVEGVLAFAGELLDLVSATDPEHRPVRYWLGQLGARGQGARDDAGQIGAREAPGIGRGFPVPEVPVPPREGSGR